MGATLLELACDRLDIDIATVMTHRVYADHIALVVNNGIKGCPKYLVPLDALIAPHPPEPPLTTEGGPLVSPNSPDPSEEPPPLPEPDATRGALRLSAEKWVNLDNVQGTGIGGRITVADVRRAIARKIA